MPNSNGEKPCGLYEIRQPNPEYTDSSYKMLRAQEEALPMCNYLQNAPNMLNLSAEEQLKFKYQVTEIDRCYGIQKIIDLHAKKEYKRETLFIAASIFDRMIFTVGL